MQNSRPILEKVTIGPYLDECVCGPKFKMGLIESEGLMSFDGACRNVREAKSKPKKTKIVEGFGDKVIVIPSFYDCMVPKSNRRSHSGSFMPPMPEFEDISSSSSHLGNSMTDFEVVR